jgi:hypothetical protein
MYNEILAGPAAKGDFLNEKRYIAGDISARPYAYGMWGQEDEP